MVASTSICMQARQAMAAVCRALGDWYSGADRRRRHDMKPFSAAEAALLAGVRAAAEQAALAGTPALEGLQRALQGVPAGKGDEAERLTRAIEAAALAADSAATGLREAGELRDAALLRRHSLELGQLLSRDLHPYAMNWAVGRWEANPETMSSKLGDDPVFAPGGHVVLDTHCQDCMGDTSYYIEALDPPSGMTSVTLYDTPIECVAISRDGLQVHEQSWRLGKGRATAMIDALTGEAAYGSPPPRRDEVVMLADIFEAAPGENFHKTPLQIRLENMPPGSEPAFVFSD